MPSAHLQVGQVCAARYSGTGEWHRCYIIDVFHKEVEVIFCATSDLCSGVIFEIFNAINGPLSVGESSRLPV